MTETIEKQYPIGDKTYVQRPLVLGQIRRLLNLLDGITIPTDAGLVELVEALGDSLPKALAVVLTEQGKHPRDTDVDSSANAIEFEINADQVKAVIEDFFLFNRTLSDSGQLTQMIDRIWAKIAKSILSMLSAPSSPEEISPDETPSSGDTG